MKWTLTKIRPSKIIPPCCIGTGGHQKGKGYAGYSEENFSPSLQLQPEPVFGSAVDSPI